MWFPAKKKQTGEKSAPAGPLSFIHATDLHYISRSLTDNGPAFRFVADHADGKTLLYVTELVQAFLAEVKIKKPEVLILGGDLSFNGEYESHVMLSGMLAEIKDAGVRVLVIPGNHDIDYSGAAAFSGTEIQKARTISAAEFRSLYGPFGYDGALSRAPDTLSYMAEVGGIFRILMLDTSTVSMCALTDKTLAWAEKVLKDSAKKRIPVLAVSHQNLMAHNPMFSAGFRIRGAEKLLKLYRDTGVLANLSGHMHLQHIRKEGLTEIATSALSLSPNQYGELSFDGKTLEYRNCPVDVSAWAADSGAEDPNLLDFADYAERYARDGAVRQALSQLSKGPGNKLPEDEKKQLAETFSRLNYAYFAGHRVPLEDLGEGIARWKEQEESFLRAYIRTILRDAEAGKDYHHCTITREET